jgi:hypothetical protein
MVPELHVDAPVTTTSAEPLKVPPAKSNVLTVAPAMLLNTTVPLPIWKFPPATVAVPVKVVVAPEIVVF